MSLANLWTLFVSLATPVQLGVVFIFSALVGSFLNVVIYRLPIMLENDWKAQAREILELPEETVKPLNLVTPRSRCRHCHRPVRALENIPIISYLIMGGKCRGCQQHISFYYPVIELLTALLATVVFYHFGATTQGVLAVFFVFALIALTGIDFKTQLLPDIITLPLMWAGIIISFWEIFIPLKLAVLGALIGYLSLWSVAMLFRILFKKEGMGLGDAKLLAALFTWIPIQHFPLVLIIACLVGITVTVTQRFIQKEKMADNPLPFGPYLALGGLVALLHGQELVAWYLS